MERALGQTLAVDAFVYTKKKVCIIYNMSLAEFFQVSQYDKKIRLGCNSDGGYVIAELDGGYDGYISAGVSNEESFTRDFLKKYTDIKKENAHAFDGTIHDYPWSYTSDITFYMKNIGENENNSMTDLAFLIEKYDRLFLKMDIEGGEYPWISTLDETKLKKFKQIVIEFHGVTNNGWGASLGSKRACLELLQKTHYIVHAHGNNHGPVSGNIPDVIELTYVVKDYFLEGPPKNTSPLPTPGLDFPNHCGLPDIPLVGYPFVQ